MLLNWDCRFSKASSSFCGQEVDVLDQNLGDKAGFLSGNKPSNFGALLPKFHEGFHSLFGRNITKNEFPLCISFTVSVAILECSKRTLGQAQTLQIQAGSDAVSDLTEEMQYSSTSGASLASLGPYKVHICTIG